MRIIPRETYDHPGPLGPALDLSRVTGWDFHHTAGPLDQSPHFIADFGVGKFGRSSYNFLASQEDREGDIWEMQGLHIGAHNDGENSTRLGIVFVGYYHPDVNHQPSDAMLEAVAKLMALGHVEWGVPIHAKGHGDTDNTACPGDRIYEHIDRVVNRARKLAAMGNTTPSEWAAEDWQWGIDVGLVNGPDAEHPSDPKALVPKEEIVAMMRRLKEKVLNT